MSVARTPLGPVDTESADRMWSAYAAAHPAAIEACADYTADRFGDSVELADELLGLVLQGPKRATATLVVEFAEEGEGLPRIGSHWIACDGSGAPRAVLRTVELRIGTFATVDPAFAYDEGEDDRTLESWRTHHRRYWERTRASEGAAWSEEDEIVLERFEVVWPPELAG